MFIKISSHNLQVLKISSTWINGRTDTFDNGLSHIFKTNGTVANVLTGIKMHCWSVPSFSIGCKYTGDFKSLLRQKFEGLRSVGNTGAVLRKISVCGHKSDMDILTILVWGIHSWRLLKHFIYILCYVKSSYHFKKWGPLESLHSFFTLFSRTAEVVCPCYLGNVLISALNLKEEMRSLVCSFLLVNREQITLF